MAEQRVTDDSSGFTLSCTPSHDGTQVRVVYNTADRLQRKVYDFAPTWPQGCDPAEATRLVCWAVNKSRDDLMDARAEIAAFNGEPHWCDEADNAAAQLATAEDQLRQAHTELARYKTAVAKAHQIMDGAIVRGGYRPGEEEQVATLGVNIVDAPRGAR